MQTHNQFFYKQFHLRKFIVTISIKHIGISQETASILINNRFFDSLEAIQTNLRDDCPAKPFLYHLKCSRDIIHIDAVRRTKLIFLKPKGYPEIEVTMLDCSNPLLFIRAEDLGLQGTEIAEFQTDKALLDHIEAIRSCAAVAFGFVWDAENATRDSLSVPKVSVFSRPQSYVGSHGEPVSGESMDICSRIVSVGAFHKTHPVTSGIAIAAAAAIEGSITRMAYCRSCWLWTAKRS